MKKIILLETIIIFVCTFFAIYIINTSNNEQHIKQYVVTTPEDAGYEVIIVDSCEYLHGYNRLTHKGNCKFCEEHRKKELEYLIDKLKENKL